LQPSAEHGGSIPSPAKKTASRPLKLLLVHAIRELRPVRLRRISYSRRSDRDQVLFERPIRDYENPLLTPKTSTLRF
jgi:hypothetical protein